MLDVRLLFIFIGAVALSNFIECLEQTQSCNIGEVVQNECNKCVCKLKNTYECLSIGCNNKDTVLGESQEKVQKTDIPPKCHPNMIYILNSIICICNKDGFWPHSHCNNIFKSLLANNLPKSKCEPNSYVIIDCNVCRCGPSGAVDNDRCTKNLCTNKTEPKSRRFSKSAKVYGTCEAKNWYSIAPCQLCFCVNTNKLVCNTGKNSKRLELGSYNLSVCGKDLIRDAIELIPEKQKVLRYGKRNENNTELRREVASETNTIPKIVKVNENKDMQVNRDADERQKKINKNNNKQVRNEPYSESGEDSQETVTLKTISRQGLSTRFPYEEDEQDSSRNEFEYNRKEKAEHEDNSDNEIGVAIEKPSPKSLEVEIGNDSELETDKPLESLKSLGNSLSAQLPMVLSKVFKMALRKSMVSLNNDSNCEPGTTTILKCNMCFCMKNRKLLCTKNDCSK